MTLMRDEYPSRHGLARLLTSEPKKYGENKPLVDNERMVEELFALLGEKIDESDGSIIPDDSAITAQEMAFALGLSRNTIVLKLRPLVRDGIVGCRDVHRPNITGRTVKVPGYFLIEEEAQNGK